MLHQQPSKKEYSTAPAISHLRHRVTSLLLCIVALLIGTASYTLAAPTLHPAFIEATDTILTDNGVVAGKPDSINYIRQAPKKLKEYYPEWEEHFRKVFKAVENIPEDDTAVMNKKLEDEFYWSDTDKGKWSIVFMFMEFGYNGDFHSDDNLFTKAINTPDEDGFDPLYEGAKSAYLIFGKYIKEELAKEKEGLAKEKEGLAKEKEKGKQLEEEWAKEKEKGKQLEEEWAKEKEELAKEKEKGRRLKEEGRRLKENLGNLKVKAAQTKKRWEATIQGGEAMIEGIKEEDLKHPEIQDLLQYYETLCRENGREMTPKAKKLIKKMNELKKKSTKPKKENTKSKKK